MEPAAIGFEVVKLLFQLAFEEARRSNLTAEQLLELYDAGKERVKEKSPDQIPDV